MNPPTDQQQEQPHSSSTSPFESLSSYPFTSDPEFAKGLSIILGHPNTPASVDEINSDNDLVLQAKCFYFSKKENLPSPLNPTDYRTWLNSNSRTTDTNTSSTSQESVSQDQQGQPHPSQPPTTQSQPHTAEPAYPSSFAHIVELITTGQPVPGIQEIPDTVLTGQDSASTKPRRLKPWEKEVDPGTADGQ